MTFSNIARYNIRCALYVQRAVGVVERSVSMRQSGQVTHLLVAPAAVNVYHRAGRRRMSIGTAQQSIVDFHQKYR